MFLLFLIGMWYFIESLSNCFGIHVECILFLMLGRYIDNCVTVVSVMNITYVCVQCNVLMYKYKNPSGEKVCMLTDTYPHKHLRNINIK